MDSHREMENNRSLSYQIKYQETRIKLDTHQSNEMMTVNFRYKPIGRDVGRLIQKMVTAETISIEKTSDDFRFSAAVAGFGMLLRDSEFKGSLAYDDVLRLAIGAKGKDANGDRAEFIQMVKICRLLAK